MAQDSSTPLKIQSNISPSDQRTFHRLFCWSLGCCLLCQFQKKKNVWVSFHMIFFTFSCFFVFKLQVQSLGSRTIEKDERCSFTTALVFDVVFLKRGNGVQNHWLFSDGFGFLLVWTFSLRNDECFFCEYWWSFAIPNSPCKDRSGYSVPGLLVYGGMTPLHWQGETTWACQEEKGRKPPSHSFFQNQYTSYHHPFQIFIIFVLL